MKHLLVILALTSVAFMAPSCKKEGCTNSSACNYDPDAEKDDGTCVNKGTVTFWQINNSGYDYTDVTINGSTAVVTSEYPNTPSCNASGCASFQLCPGTYAWTAEEQFPGTTTWSGTVTVSEEGCTTMWLQ
jgi:hypothetical protein